MEQRLRADHPVVAPERHRTRLGKRLAPYGLIASGGLWLLVFFVVPMFTMLMLSLETPVATTGFVNAGYRFTWHVGQFGDALSQYHTEFVRSLLYGLFVTAVSLVVGYPAAYWIAFRGRDRKTIYLFMLLLPFFVSFVIRSLAWQFLLSDNGLVLRSLERVHLLPFGFHIIGTPWAVMAGIAYNSLPFMVLPLYVSLEKIDISVVEAAQDLYSSGREVFTKVIFPLSVPGIFAGFLLTFVPAVGDYVNATILGGPTTTMIGNIIQFQFLQAQDYPMASALSFILMAVLLVGIIAYARVLGTRQIEEYV
ncbi:MAG: ABC transporter permease [Actinomycetota bacterium]